jgi:hypothetical protein
MGVQLSDTDVNQFSIITELLGTPPDDVIQTIASENVSFETSRIFTRKSADLLDSPICAESAKEGEGALRDEIPERRPFR